MKWIGMQDNGQQVVLQKFEGAFTPKDAGPQASLRRGLVLDVETTGLDRERDQIIQFAALPFLFDKDSGELVEVGEMFESLHDPGEPLSPEIVALTGLTDEMLAGHELDEAGIRELLSNADVVIAHNAEFDRQMVEARLGVMRKVWACSFRMIDWRALGYPSSKLELVAVYHGFFYEAHRADADVAALLHLLTFHNEDLGSTYLSELLGRARRSVYRVEAQRSPFETKDMLKARGYRWSGTNRVWWTEVSEDELEAEVAWLDGEVYPLANHAVYTKITPFERFGKQEV